jgi:hypothetical protein
MAVGGSRRVRSRPHQVEPGRGELRVVELDDAEDPISHKALS